MAGWMALIFALSSRGWLLRPPDLGPDLTAIAGHFAVYAVLAALLWWGLASRGVAARRRLALAFVPGRDPALVGLVVDAGGALCALAGMRVLAPVRDGTQAGTGVGQVADTP